MFKRTLSDHFWGGPKAQELAAKRRHEKYDFSDFDDPQADSAKRDWEEQQDLRKN